MSETGTRVRSRQGIRCGPCIYLVSETGTRLRSRQKYQVRFVPLLSALDRQKAEIQAKYQVTGGVVLALPSLKTPTKIWSVGAV